MWTTRGSEVSQYVAFWSILILKHVSKLPLRKQNFSLKNRPSGEGSAEGWLANGLHVPCCLDGQAGGGEMPAWACLQRQRGGRCLGSRGLGRGSYGPEAHVLVPRASPSPLAETVDGEALWCPSLRPFSCSLPGLGSLFSWDSGPTLAPPASSMQGFPADAPPDCGLSHIQNRASWHRCSHSLALTRFLEKSQSQRFSILL